MKNYVKQLRQERGLSQKKLASLGGVSRQTINALENGRLNPSFILAYKITILLEPSSMEDLFIVNEDDIDWTPK